MIYRTFKGKKLSLLGFGCMRFKADPATGEIDQAKVNEMFDLAIEAGVNYFDTAYPYLGGKSETAMAEALSRYPRESYFIADKFPGHSINRPIDNIALFNRSLEKCRTDYFDFYLLHNINEWSEEKYESEEYHILPDILKMKEEGKIRSLGFSFHGGPELLDEFLTRHEGEFDFVQIQLNYLDWTLQDAKAKYEIIARHGLGVWVMEPCRGGKLASLPESQSAKLKALYTFSEKTDGFPSDASYAFRFLQELPEVKVVLSGMNEVEQVKDNVKTFSENREVTKEEKELLKKAASLLRKDVPMPCTGCRYCTPNCPMELNIPELLISYNESRGHDSWRLTGLWGLPEDRQPKACIGCGACTAHCPQSLDIPSAMREMAEDLERMR